MSNDTDVMEFAVNVPGAPAPISMSYNGVKFFPSSELDKARSEVLAAHLSHLRSRACNCNSKHEHDKLFSCRWTVAEELELLQPAAADLEAHDDYVRKLRDMDWIREFPVVNQHWCPGFPEGVKPYLEALLREEREKVKEACLAACRMARNDAKERALRGGTYFWGGREAGADACIDGIEQLSLDGHGDGKE